MNICKNMCKAASFAFAFAAISGSAIAAARTIATTKGFYVVDNEEPSSVVYKPKQQQQQQQMQEESNNFYIGAKFALNFSSFTYKFHLASDTGPWQTDSYAFKQQMGYDLTAGYQFDPKWRAELNVGNTGTFEDSDTKATMSISSTYLLANLIYTIRQWSSTSIYVGGGLGAAFIHTDLSGSDFALDGKEKRTTAAFAGQAIFGVEEALTQSFSINAQYRLMYSGGQKRDREIWDSDILHNKFSGILTNSIMLGARFKF